MLDLFDRKVMGWALSADRESGHTTIPALEMAVGADFSLQPRDPLLREIVSGNACEAFT
jgi:transposase InsO family protein